MKEKSTLFKRDFTLVVIGQIISLFGNANFTFCPAALFIAGNRFICPVWNGNCLFFCANGSIVDDWRCISRQSEQAEYHGWSGLFVQRY